MFYHLFYRLKTAQFQIILSLVIMWSLCGILTATDSFPEGNAARVVNLTEKVSEANWFYFPYPGKRNARPPNKILLLQDLNFSSSTMAISARALKGREVL